MSAGAAIIVIAPLFAAAIALLAIGTCVLILCVGSVGAVQFPAEASTSDHAGMPSRPAAVQKTGNVEKTSAFEEHRS